MKKLSSFITRFSSYTGALVFGVLLGISTSAVFAWTAPTEAPPGGNVSMVVLLLGEQHFLHRLQSKALR